MQLTFVLLPPGPVRPPCPRGCRHDRFSCSFFFFFCSSRARSSTLHLRLQPRPCLALSLLLDLSHNIQLTPQKLSAGRKNRSGAKGTSAWPEGQRRHRGRRPGRRRYREVLLPERSSRRVPSFSLLFQGLFVYLALEVAVMTVSFPFFFFFKSCITYNSHHIYFLCSARARSSTLRWRLLSRPFIFLFLFVVSAPPSGPVRLPCT